MLPLVNYDDEFRWEVISQLSDKDILSNIQISWNTDQMPLNTLELLGYIYHHSCYRDIWKKSRLDRMDPSNFLSL